MRTAAPYVLRAEAAELEEHGRHPGELGLRWRRLGCGAAERLRELGVAGAGRGVGGGLQEEGAEVPLHDARRDDGRRHVGERAGDGEVVAARGPVEDREDTEDRATVVQDRYGEDRVRDVADPLGDLSVEAWIVLDVVDGERLPGGGHEAGDALPERKGLLRDDLGARADHGQPAQLAGVLVQVGDRRGRGAHRGGHRRAQRGQRPLLGLRHQTRDRGPSARGPAARSGPP